MQISSNGHSLLDELTRLVAHPERAADGGTLMGELRELISAESARRPTLRVACFGAFRVAGAGGWDAGPQPRRARELLQYLVLHPKSVAPRERLIALFWPGENSEDVVHRLHLAASAVRGSLRRTLGGFDPLRCSASGYSWDPAVRVECDVEIFTELYRDGSVRSFKEAVPLYTGELLTGEQGDWLQPARVKYAAMYVAMLDRIAQSAFAEHNFEEALHYGLELLDVDRAHEGASQLVMQCFAALGHRSHAVGHYETLRTSLANHLGLQPTRETHSVAANGT